MKCPVCQVPAYVVEFQGIELDLCPDCQGIWFDAGELDLLLEQGQALPKSAASTKETVRSCPLCRHHLNKVNIGPGRRVLVDDCPSGCGIWFDHDELQALTRDLTEDGWQLEPRVRAFLSEMFPTKGD